MTYSCIHQNYILLDFAASSHVFYKKEICAKFRKLTKK